MERAYTGLVVYLMRSFHHCRSHSEHLINIFGKDANRSMICFKALQKLQMITVTALCKFREFVA